MRRLSLLYVSQVPPSPPRFGAQVRMHGLMTAMAERHEVSVACCAEPDELPRARRALGAYCRDVELVVDGISGSTARKRLLQLRSLASTRTFERLLFTTPELQRRIDALLARGGFDVVVLEGPFLAHHRLRRGPGGAAAPRIVLDEHNVEYDVRRQFAGRGGPVRRLFTSLNWRKMRREEHAVWDRVDGVTVTSAADAARVRADRPGARVAVVPNAVDVDLFRPRAGDPAPDRSTLLFFGALDYYPNLEGLLWFLDEVWPRVLESHPAVRLRILGRRPPPALVARQGPRVEVAGFVEDLRPSLAAAAAVIVPLRLGGGTRLKILEAMAMERPVVSTTVGAEGIDVAGGRELLLADEPERFAAEVRRLLDDPALGSRLGRSARALVAARYSWRASARGLERFLFELCRAERHAGARTRAGVPAASAEPERRPGSPSRGPV
jgi:sugar transferase (PEP-CTERM/EpsH1 system associated)